MCLTIPAKVESIDENSAVVRDFDSEKKIRIEALAGMDVKKGDWILYVNDYAVQKISADDASEIIGLLENHHPRIDNTKLSRQYADIIEASKRRQLEKEEISYLLRCEGMEKDALFAEADVLRKTHLKDFLCIHGIIEFSNHCKNDCAYCGLRAQNKNLSRYRMPEEEIVQAALDACDKGYKLLILQSGEDPFYTDDMLVNVIERIKKDRQVFIFVSVGERGRGSYERFKKAGASGVLFRFETSNPEIFAKLHQDGKNMQNRFRHLEFLKELKYYIATGSIIGLPGQSEDDVADDLLLAAKWANMVSMGPFVPSSGTSMAGDKCGDPDLYYKAIAVMRLMMPKSRIPVVTALETLAGEEGRKKALLAGANSLMLNVTPEKYRTEYKIYDNRFFQAETLWEKYGLFRQEESYEMIKERMEEELG